MSGATEGWERAIEGLLRTDFGRAVSPGRLLAVARQRYRRNQRRWAVAIWCAAAVLMILVGSLGLRLGSGLALGRDRLIKLEATGLLTVEAPVEVPVEVREVPR